jgi:hypothetical protein
MRGAVMYGTRQRTIVRDHGRIREGRRCGQGRDSAEQGN